MQVYQIVLLVLLAVLVITASVFCASYRAMLKNGTQYITVGTVQYFQKGKIPFLGTAVIRYTKKGKPYQAHEHHPRLEAAEDRLDGYVHHHLLRHTEGEIRSGASPSF